jgi:hypothetical protein
MKIQLKNTLFFSFLTPLLANASDFHGFVPNSTTPCHPQSQMRFINIQTSEKTEQKNTYLISWYKKETIEMKSHSEPSRFKNKAELGGEFLVLRCLPPGRFVTIGKGKVERINGNMVEGFVYSEKDSSPIRNTSALAPIESGNLMWRPMAGDSIYPLKKEISKIKSILPQIKLFTNNLFLQDGENHYSYTLSEQGQNKLREAFESLKNKKGRLFVEGFILNSGDRESLKIESLIRAQTVATFLTHEFSLEQNTVVPLGFGNDWRKTGMQAIEENENQNWNNGILLKVL